MFTILVPTDFSESARAAADYAAQVAKVMNGSILLFHAYMLPTPVSEIPYVLVTADALQQENENDIAREASRLHNTYQIQAEWLVRIGIPSTEVQVLTEERAISLIVMGMKGENALEKIIGSTTTNTLKKVHTPVLVIPENAVFKPVKNITLASNFSAKIPASIFNPLLQLAEAFQSSLNIIHIIKEGAKMTDEEMDGKSNLEPIFRNLPRQYVEIFDHKVVEGIQHFAASHAVDLVVMVAQPHTFFENLFGVSQTRKMAFETHVPLLILSQQR